MEHTVKKADSREMLQLQLLLWERIFILRLLRVRLGWEQMVPNSSAVSHSLFWRRG